MNGKDRKRKFDWENLFWSCGHCNGVKNNRKYDEGIIDCCKSDPEKRLFFQVTGDDVEIVVMNDEDDEAKRTAGLITEVFSLRNTGMRTYTSAERMKLLKQEMSVLYKQLEILHKKPDSKVTIRKIRSLLRRESAFAAFKRCYVREHAERYPQLQQYVALD